jgi:hypothetical protein
MCDGGLGLTMQNAMVTAVHEQERQCTCCGSGCTYALSNQRNNTFPSIYHSHINSSQHSNIHTDPTPYSHHRSCLIPQRFSSHTFHSNTRRSILNPCSTEKPLLIRLPASRLSSKPRRKMSCMNRGKLQRSLDIRLVIFAGCAMRYAT